MRRNLDIKMARFLAGEMGTKEEIAFRQEVEDHPDQMSELRNMEKTWKYFDENPSRKNTDSIKAWDKLERRLQEDGLLEGNTVAVGKKQILPALRIAASILLILALGIPALYFGVIRNNTAEPVHSHIAREGINTVDLPDGSRVYLNKGTEISYSGIFRQNRTVQLKGEAFFEVMADPTYPFTVHSGRVVVSVLGTSFNVKQGMNSQDVEVYVDQGKVRMSMDDSEQSITLNPGEIGEMDNRNLTKTIQLDLNYISWKTKDFKFVDAALKDVLHELEESYHVKIQTDQMELNDMRITTSYSQQSIDAILETICTAFGLTVSNREGEYYLSN